MIHRDIKPANFLLGKDEQVLLSDFGIAVTAHTTYSTYSMPLQDISGTPAYMAPEQFDGKSRRASDQYALGVIVYEWLCGERPFSGPSFALYALQHKTVPPTSLMKMGATIPPSIEQVVLKALEKDPKERFARVQDFADALEQAYHTYVEEITAWLNRSEYTVEMLRSEDVQYALLHRSSAHPEWWKQEGQARINALHQKGEKEADRMVTTVLTALAEKAKSQVVTAVNQENETVFETMLSVMTSCATPSSQYPAVWTSLLHELTSGKAHAFIVKHETVYAELLRQWSSMSPAVDTTLIRPWLPLSWLEFGTLFSLHLPDEWIYIALTPLLDTPIPSEALERIEQSETGLVEGFFRYLLVPQRQSTAMRWFVRLVESGYRGRMSLLHLLLTADLKEQVMQQVMEWVFASPHFTEGERAEILETYGKQFLSYLERSPILLGHIREYLQTFDISGLETSSPTKAFLRSLRDFAQRLPPDIQLTVSSWCEVIDFIDQPITERARLKGLATTISSLPAETYPRLIHMLARTFVSCLEDEFDLINIVDAMSPVLKAETLNLPRNMADIVGKAEKQQHTEMRLIPYIRFALEIEKVYDPLPADQERFVHVFLDSLLQSANDNTFRNLHKLITTQNWPQKAFARWNEYASRRISKLGLQPATSTGSSLRERNHPLSRKRVVLLIALAILIVVGSFGAFYATRRTSPNPYPPYPPYTGTLALDDSLSGNSLTWSQSSDSSGSCASMGDAYHVISVSTAITHSCTNGVSFSNFVYQVQMRIARGNSGGIVFRGTYDSTRTIFYYFRIGQDGSYDLDLVDNNSLQPLKSGSSPTLINTGLNQPNLLAVVAKGRSFDLYVNLHHIDSVSDSTLTSGEIGVAASDTSDPTEVLYNNAEVWAL